jgi:1,4-alpha-glucan branching enzyme
MPYTSFMTLFSDFDINLFKAGKHYKIYEKLGNHLVEHDGQQGVYFAVWAPNAKRVSVIGDFNNWNAESHILNIRFDGSGIWEGFVPNVGQGALYKYHIISNVHHQILTKTDPFAFHMETPPKTASVVWDINDHTWNDNDWIHYRYEDKDMAKPYSVYEVHLGSWKRKSEGKDDWYSYRELAEVLVPYVKDMGFTHIELMPVTEHPFFGSWGYQVTGYFAPSSRYGTPQDLMYLINAFHEAGIGVIVDWVPSHFPGDAHGLYNFDGTHLYEHADPRLGFHPDWNSYIFNYGRNEIRSFLISSALFWLEKFHVDAIRVDAVASMLYLDYSRKHGEWIPNKYGGKENLEAIGFIKEMNEAVAKAFPGVITIAEESTAWPNVTKPTYMGGLGFHQKWMMGWMNDSLRYFERNPIYRKFHQGELTFSLIYAFSENFMLPLSHDEVVHGKGALIDKMPGDEWQKFANLRLLYGMMYTHPGMQLLFMGSELGQFSEWNHDKGLDWHLLDRPLNKGLQAWVKDLNYYFKSRPALYDKAFESEGFEWVASDDNENCVLIFTRKGNENAKSQVVVCHLLPNVIHDYRFGVPVAGTWTEVMHSDDEKYGGSGVLNGDKPSEAISSHGKKQSIAITLPPLGIACFELS